MVKLRSICQAVNDIRASDPGSAMTEGFLRLLIENGDVSYEICGSRVCLNIAILFKELASLFELEKMSHGGIREQSREEARPQNEALLSGSHKTARKIAEEHGISRASVERSGEYVKALDIAKEHDPNIERDIMTGEINPSKKDVIHIGKASKEEVPDLVKQLREQKKPPTKKKAGDSIGTISARMAEDKPPATEEDMMVSLQAAVKTLIRTFETTLQYYPDILENPDHRVSLKRIIKELKKYLNTIEGEST